MTGTKADAATTIQAIIESTPAAGLRRALWEYWPTRQDFEVSEATPLLYLARAFQDRDFDTYMEVPHHVERQRLDLLAMRWSDGLVVGVEGKRLYSAEQAGFMAADLENLLDFQAPWKADISELPPGDAWAVIVGTTWHKSIVAWWKEHGRAASPNGSRAEGWRDLATALQDCDIVDAVDIYDPAELGRWKQQYLVYAIARVPGGFRL